MQKQQKYPYVSLKSSIYLDLCTTTTKTTTTTTTASTTTTTTATTTTNNGVRLSLLTMTNPNQL